MGILFIFHLFYITVLQIESCNVISGGIETECFRVEEKLSVIPSKIKKDCVIIDVSGNKISKIDAEDFRGLHSLQNLVLSNNRLTAAPNLTLLADTLLCLDLSGNRIVKINENDFEGLYMLQELSLSSNRLTSLPRLEHLAGNLVSLDVSKNKLEQLNGSIFTGFNMLQRLELQNCRQNDFPDLSPIAASLKYLTFHANNISNIPLNLIMPLYALEEISLSKNINLDSIPELNVLGKTLRYLSLYDIGSIGVISAETFKSFEILDYINLDKNNITEFPDFKHIATTLKFLRLRDNKMSHIPVHLLHPLTALEFLDLARNQISEFYSALGPANSLKVLRLYGNPLISFPDISEMSINLEVLRVYDNLYTHIPPENFVFLNRNQSVNLSIYMNNVSIETIPPIVGPNLNNLTIVANDVPLVCDVRIAWVILLPEPMRDTLIGTCYQPLELRGIALQNITLDNLKPNNTAGIVSELVYSKGRMLAKDVYSNTLPVITVFTKSAHSCLLLCARTPGCLYINYFDQKIENKDVSDNTIKENCHYAAPFDGFMYDTPDEASGWKYYHVSTS